MGSDRRREEIQDLETGHTEVLLLSGGRLGAELSQGEEAVVRKSGKRNRTIVVTLRKKSFISFMALKAFYKTPFIVKMGAYGARTFPLKVPQQRRESQEIF